ncbi:glycosyltransferase family 4 protein [Candidatus Eisenbacteria bacterium]|uniref:Glycosyltransferase family 4 protein n=1 Tax=Eiseniibacteriota bacterium TaxID=2212470 RepID=A0ABV6YQS0_UNCEI
MKIAMVTQSYYPRVGGVSEHVHYLSAALRRLGHEVAVITSGPGTSRDRDTIRIGRNTVFPINGAMVNVTVGLRLRKQIRQTITDGDYDLVHIHCPLEPTFPLATLMAVRDLHCPTVGTFHMAARVSPAYEAFGTFLQKHANRLDARIAVSETARTFANKYFPGDYHLVPNGVDFERFASGTQRVPELDDGKVNILFVGRFDLRKNIPATISAFQRVSRKNKNCRLVLVGKGFTEPWCRLKARGSAVGDILFKGCVRPAELPAYFTSSHIFCSVPRGSESFGIVLLEAMAAGKPVIGADIPGYRDVVEDGVTGILVPPGQTGMLADAMSHLAQDQGERSRMGENGRRKAMEYDWSRLAARIENIYRGLHGPPENREDHDSAQLKTAGLP